MFSEKFYVEEKYNLSSKDYIGTNENIFYEFTSLKNEMYKPEMGDTLKQKFKDILNYTFDKKLFFIPDNTFFGVTYFGGDVIKYDLKTRFRYNVLKNESVWNDFISKTKLYKLSSLRYVIDEKTSKTDGINNYVSDLNFDLNGDITGIGVYDVKYKEGRSNSDILNINNFSNIDRKYNNFLVFNTDKTYKSILTYNLPVMKGEYKRSLKSKNLYILEKTKYENYHQEIITDMIENNIINQDDADFIQSHLSGERYFTLEFDIDVNEKIVNRTVGIVTHNLFREL